MAKSVRTGMGALLFACSAHTGAQAGLGKLSGAPSADTIVVTARRSGIPVWRVDGAGTTLVLVGTIAEVAEGTSWDPQSLLAALRSADRVMFPASVQYTASILTLLQLQAKSRRMAMLPKGHSLSEYVSSADYQRLSRLQARGILKSGFERKHPRQIVQELMQYAQGERPSAGFFTIERVKPGTDPDGFVRAAVRKYKIELVPLPTAKLKPIVSEVFNADTAAITPCLRAAITLAEAGPGAVTARSQAWAHRDVRAVLTGSAQQAIDACRPASIPRTPTAEVRRTVRSLLNQRQTTVAVIDLPLLAQPGGLLDELSNAGFEIRGPAWK